MKPAAPVTNTRMGALSVQIVWNGEDDRHSGIPGESGVQPTKVPSHIWNGR
jgi:hypothetical protein